MEWCDPLIIKSSDVVLPNLVLIVHGDLSSKMGRYYVYRSLLTSLRITLLPSGLRAEPRFIVLYAAYSRSVQRLYVIATL